MSNNLIDVQQMKSVYNTEKLCFLNRVCSRNLSRLLSVSALAWPFVVINRKVCSSASRIQCKEIVFERSNLSAEVKSRL